MEDKEILYTMIKREVYNFLYRTFPALCGFSDLVADKLIKFVDPYVNAFVEDDEVNVDQLGDFAKSEIDNKIKAFKASWKADKSYEE